MMEYTLQDGVNGIPRHFLGMTDEDILNAMPVNPEDLHLKQYYKNVALALLMRNGMEQFYRDWYPHQKVPGYKAYAEEVYEEEACEEQANIFASLDDFHGYDSHNIESDDLSCYDYSSTTHIMSKGDDSSTDMDLINQEEQEHKNNELYTHYAYGAVRNSSNNGNDHQFDWGSKQGTVRRILKERGFGFIAPDDGSNDVFVHFRGVVDGQELRENDKVRYELEYTKSGQLRATNVSGGSGGGFDGWADCSSHGSVGGCDDRISIRSSHRDGRAICHHFRNGYCRFGMACKYAHVANMGIAASA